jgi:N-carbamoylputrescine amidase
MDKASKRVVNLGLIQMASTESVSENYNKTMSLIEEAAKQGAQIVCTQELFKSRYFCQSENSKHFALAEEIDEESAAVKELSELSAELGIVLIASLFEKRAPGLHHNTTVVLDADGSYLGKYRKMHIPDDPRYYEKFYFAPGDLGYKVFDTKYARIGVLICWDQWFPEAVRLLGLQGAELVCIPTAIGYSTKQEESGYDRSWKTVQQGHAVANACFLAAVNRVGFELDPTYPNMDPQKAPRGVGPQGEVGINFWGGSFVANPDGMIIKEASPEKDEILICPINLDEVNEAKNLYSFPYRDRRVDSYQDLLKLYSD